MIYQGITASQTEPLAKLWYLPDIIEVVTGTELAERAQKFSYAQSMFKNPLASARSFKVYSYIFDTYRLVMNYAKMLSENNRCNIKGLIAPNDSTKAPPSRLCFECI